MNIRNVLRTYSLLRQLSDDESALLETLRSLSDNEREQLVESLAPAKTTTKKSASKQRVYEHCAQCDKTKGHSFHKDSTVDGYHEFQSAKPKSARASGMATVIKKNLNQQRQAAARSACAGVIEFDGGNRGCEAPEDDEIHNPLSGYAGYHPFVSAALSNATPAASGE